MKVILLLILLLGAATSQGETLTNRDLDQYVIRFLTDGDRYRVHPDLSGFGMTFSDQLPPGVLGICMTIGDDRWIFVDRGTYNRADGIEREAVLYHEMGHCLLNRPHKTATIGEIPISIMYPDNRLTTYYRRFYLKHKEGYLRELFLGH